jgi:hypothetical protein
MAYGLKYYFVDKKLVGTTDTTYTFEILEDGYSGSTTEWVGVDIRRQFEELSFRRIEQIQKSLCGGVVRVVDATQRSAIETIAGSEIGDYKVQLKRDGTVIWTGLVVPDLISIGEQNYGNQTAEIVAKDLFFTGDYPLTTIFPDTRGTEKAIVLIADILDNLGFGLDIVSYTIWTEDSITESDDILNQSYHEKERFRIFAQNEGESDKPLSNQQALEYILKAYGLILRQVSGKWNLVQVTAFSDPASVRRYVYNSSGTQTSSSTSYSLGSSAVSDELYVLGSSSNNYFAGLKKSTSKFQHNSLIQGIKFQREYWINDAGEIAKSQFWQADGTGNLELFFVTWFAKTTDTDLGNPVVANVSIYIDTGTTDYYWNGTSWVTSPATIEVEVEETYSTTDSDGNYLYKNNGLSIVTDPIPDGADGDLNVKITPDSLQPNYAYWYLRSLDFNLAYSDTQEGVSSAIVFELEQTKNYSDVYDYGTYYFGDGPTSASLSALKDSSDNLLTLWKRSGDVSTITHQQLLLSEFLNTRRNQRRNIRATLYGEYEPEDVLSYDSTNFFFLGGSWSSRSYVWQGNFVELNEETGTDTLNTFYETEGGSSSSGAVGSTNGTVGSSGSYLEKGKNLSDVPTPSTARTNLGLGTGDSPTFAGLTVNGSISVTGNVDGRDVSADGANLDELYTTIGLSALTASEVNQLENIGSVTMSNTQWGYLGALDQSLTTSSDVQFDDITLTGIVKTNEIDALADLIWDDTSNTEIWNTSDFYANNAVNIGSNVYITDELDVEEALRVGTTLNVGGNATLGGTADISGNTTIGGSLTLSGSADFNSTMNLQGNLTTQANLADDGFSEGWAGTNWKINADGSAEFEEMRIRGALRVYEFIAKQISTIGGSEILSIAQGRVVSAGSGEIEIENVTGTPGNSFKAGDLFICQVVDINNDLESGGTGSIVKSVRGLVDSVSGNDLTVTIESGSLDDLEQGDLIVGYGSTSDADRQAIMYRNVDRSEDNLIMRLQTGITEFSKLQAVANTRVAFGDLYGYSGLSSETFGFFAGKNAEEHVLVTDTGIFFKNGLTIGAQLSSNVFKIGDNDNFISFNTASGTLDIESDTFDLVAGDLRIDSADREIQIADNTTRKVTINDNTTFSTVQTLGSGSGTVSVIDLDSTDNIVEDTSPVVNVSTYKGDRIDYEVTIDYTLSAAGTNNTLVAVNVELVTEGGIDTYLEETTLFHRFTSSGNDSVTLSGSFKTQTNDLNPASGYGYRLRFYAAEVGTREGNVDFDYSITIYNQETQINKGGFISQSSPTNFISDEKISGNFELDLPIVTGLTFADLFPYRGKLVKYQEVSNVTGTNPITGGSVTIKPYQIIQLDYTEV